MTVAASSFGARYGPWALVAGASMGLGAEYARQIAARGLNVVLVAWPAEGLEEVARDLERRSGKSSDPAVSTFSSSVPGRPGPRAGSRAAPTAEGFSRPPSWSPLRW